MKSTEIKRKDPNLTDIVGALIVQHFGIPHEIAKKMTRQEIIALIHVDHFPVQFAIARDLGWGPDLYNHPSNLFVRFPEEHVVKSATVDVPAIAKADRIADSTAEFQRRMLAKVGLATGQKTGRAQPKHRWPQGRKIQSRPFPKRSSP